MVIVRFRDHRLPAAGWGGAADDQSPFADTFHEALAHFRQPLLAVLAIMMLDPQGADSLLAWGFFHEILRCTEYIEGYVIAPLAEKMLAADPAARLQ